MRGIKSDSKYLSTVWKHWKNVRNISVVDQYQGTKTNANDVHLAYKVKHQLKQLS